MISTQVLFLCRIVKDIKTFRQHCHSYFMEVVSTLCFGGQSAPEPDLINTLMENFFPSKDTKSDVALTFLTDGKKDNYPVVRSSLLQLLLEHK